MKTIEQLHRSIDRFQQVFWDKRASAAGDHPPVAVAPAETFMPIAYLRRPFEKSHLEPADVTPERVRTDYEHVAPHRKVTGDDFMPFVTPWRAVPWLEAMCGCPVRYADGSLCPDHFVASASELAATPIPADVRWIDRMAALIGRQLAALPADVFVSPTILRGPADVIAAMRGQVEFFTDVVDSPDVLRATAGRVADLFIGVLRHHFSLVKPKLGGWVHSYGYWSPHPTVVIQNDAMGMCGPRVYRELFREHDQRMVAALGPGVFFHLHSTGMAHWPDVLEIDGLAGLELSVERIGPPLADLTPMIRAVLERSRLILFVEHHIYQLPQLLRDVPHEGLFVIVPDTHLPTEEAFQRFLADSFSA